MFWIKPIGGTFKALQKKLFDPKKKLNNMHMLKSAILAIFQKGLGWSCPQKCIIHSIWKILCVLGANWKAKLECDYSCMLEYSKITVCYVKFPITKTSWYWKIYEKPLGRSRMTINSNIDRTAKTGWNKNCVKTTSPWWHCMLI